MVCTPMFLSPSGGARQIRAASRVCHMATPGKPGLALRRHMATSGPNELMTKLMLTQICDAIRLQCFTRLQFYTPTKYHMLYAKIHNSIDWLLCIFNFPIVYNAINLTWYFTPGFWLDSRIFVILSAAFTGTVLFSTTILLFLATSAIFLAADSMYFKSAARPYKI